MEGRIRLSADRRREQLLEVAGEAFARHGYHGLSMEQLADAAGVSKPVLYQHFPSKRDLYLAIVRDAVAQLERRVGNALLGTTSNRDRVHGAISAYFDFVEDRRFRLLFATAELTDADVREAVESAMVRVANAVAVLIAEDAGLSGSAAEFLASGLRGLAMDGARWWAGQEAVGRDEAVRLLSQLAWRGLGSFSPEP
ncbi:MAG: TetR/AcrR family transcriptional regulator [Euzebyaceae bacterium]|jgi:AcrR family transcriptional regulator|nr:TetR/AcrR family transcriptional regulator [Euzebyaceae bacterium]